MVTHAHELVKQYDHRIVVLKEGEIIADGFDKAKILGLINPETPATDAGFYNAPNEFDDVEKFIFTYGQENVPVEETIPETPDALKEENIADAAATAEIVAGEIVSEVTSIDYTAEEKQPEQPLSTTEETAESQPASSASTAKPAYSIEDDEDINSILAAFAASSASRKKTADDTDADNTDSCDEPAEETDGGDAE